mgnify:FL=1
MGRKSTIYVAGPMRGHHDYNYPAFDRQTRVLKAQGWKVVNPADMDRSQFQPDNSPHDFDPDINYEDQEFMRDALKRDMVAICDDCTAIYMMAGWESSKGAKAEHALAKALGLDIYYEAPLPSNL